MQKKYSSGVHEKTDRRRLGNLGEDLAERYLTEQGFEIVGRNINSPLGEIDVLARKEKRLHFCEVKTASQHFSQFGKKTNFDPIENLHQKKIARLSRSIHSYLQQNKIVGPWQLDALLVYVDQKNKKTHIKHLENITIE